MAVFLPVVVYGKLPLLIMAYLLAIVALKEVLNMKNIKLYSLPGIISVIALCLIMSPEKVSLLRLIIRFLFDINEFDYAELYSDE